MYPRAHGAGLEAVQRAVDMVGLVIEMQAPQRPRPAGLRAPVAAQQVRGDPEQPGKGILA